MESKYLIQKEDIAEPPLVSAEQCLDVMEFFYNTIQGEGINQGIPAAFLRLQGCTLDCIWCDTEWRKGARYSFAYLLNLIEESPLINQLRQGHHLILTGGSPLKQQKNLIAFVLELENRLRFSPYIEVENECTLWPTDEMTKIVNQWNNSPKLQNSNMKKRVRYKPDLIKFMAGLDNSWFKFVVSSPEDWYEIYQDFIAPKLIRRSQIILMPQAETLEELMKNQHFVFELAIREGVLYSTRQQLILNKP